jgi:cytoskeleton protein RodZ
MAALAGATAGGLLRQARQAQGLHIAALAAAIKVAPRKLDALENDRFDELLDATFARALAQTVCRTLKIDAAPVLALLPVPPGHRLEHVSEGSNAPFRERPGRAPVRDWSMLASPAIWGPALIVLAAGAVYLLPPGLFSGARPSAGSASGPAVPAAAPTATQPAASAIVIETVHSAPVLAAEAASAPGAGLTVAGVLQLRASSESWVEVLDGKGQTLMSRLVQPGEIVGLDGAMPLKLRIGNAGATQVSFRGRTLDLSAHTRDNVARLDLN